MKELLASIEGLRRIGFRGFRSVESLRADQCRSVPGVPGVYVVVAAPGFEPRFLAKGTGPARFGTRRLNYGIDSLRRRWVEDAAVLYIGKAGGTKSDRTLKDRVLELIRYGQGDSVPHRGGRSIWQLRNTEKLRVCWRTAVDRNPREYEKRLIRDFRAAYEGHRPFANLRD